MTKFYFRIRCNFAPRLSRVASISSSHFRRIASDITKRALAVDASCARTIARFAAILGSTAGDFALTYGARGGVYIAGGICPSILSFLEQGEFRRRFE